MKRQVKDCQIILKKKKQAYQKKKLQHKLISITISNKHPEIDTNDHEIQKCFIDIQLINKSRIR